MALGPVGVVDVVCAELVAFLILNRLLEFLGVEIMAIYENIAGAGLEPFCEFVTCSCTCRYSFEVAESFNGAQLGFEVEFELLVDFL